MRAGSIQVRVLGILAIGVICSLIACSGGGGSTGAGAPTQGTSTAVGLVVVPSSSDVNAGENLSITAKVSGTSDTAVTWNVDGIPNGNASVGVISGSGTTVSYIAPDAEGTHTLTVTSTADPTKQASTKVNVHPGSKAVSVALSPTSAALVTGATQSFSAAVANTANTSVTWAVDNLPNGNGTVGLVTGSGNTIVYTAPATAGSHVLVATSVADGTKSASSTITVQVPPSTVSVSLSPASSSLNTGASTAFTATVAGTSNTAVTWSVDGITSGSTAVGTITGSGLAINYTAPASAGTHTITATSVQDTSKSATSHITVSVPTGITSVAVSPSVFALNVGTQAQFTATVTGSGSYSSAVTWSAQRGSITSTGLYTAPATGGSDAVTATSVQDTTQSATVTGSVSVSASISSVTVSPATLTLNAGTQNQFTAAVAGSGTYSSAVTWTAQRGSVTSTGLYTAPATGGSDVVTATSVQDNTKTASSSLVVVVPPGISAVAVSPTTLTLNVGTQNQFTAAVTGSGTYSSAVTWTAQRGSITSAGFYTAPATSGSDTVTATSVQDSTKTASSSLTVVVPAGISSVAVSPTTLSVNVGTQNQFAATVTGTGTYSSAVTWTAQRGSITSTGLYTAPATGGSDTVTAMSVQDTTKSAAATITVSVPATITVVVVSPTTFTLNAGSQNQFTTTVSGTGTYSSSVTWTAQRGTITSAGLYTAPATGGTDIVTATSVQDRTKTASASITVSAAVSITSVSISQASVTLNVSTANQFTATVSGTGSYSSALIWSAQRGSITSTGLYTAPSTTGTDVVTATSSVDTSKSASSTVTVQNVTVPSGFIVAPNGVAGNPGTLAAPTTLEGARTLIQNASRATAGTLRVLLRGGIYPRSTTFTLGSTDSGTTANPVEYDAYPNETPRIIGGVSVAPTAAHLVDGTDPNWSRLDPATRSLIYVVDLTAYKSSLGALTSRSDASGGVNQSMEVFVDGAPLTLARYPKAVDVNTTTIAPHASIHVSGTLTPDVTGDYAYKGLDSRGRPYYQLAKNGDLWSIAASATGPDWHLSNRHDLGGTGTLASWGVWDTFAGPAGAFINSSGATGTALLSPTDGSNAIPGFMMIRSTNGTSQIVAPDSRMSLWKSAEAMYFGLGYYSWSSSHSTITSMDPTTGSIVLSGAPTYGLRTGQPFFIYNLLEELTAPGECFIDRVNARLYLRPMGDVAPTEILLSTLQTPLVQMTGCQQITWQGVTFEAAKDRLIYATSCQSVAFKTCQFRNTGGYGILLNGTSNLVEACDFRQLGKGGVMVSGGNRTTLTPSGTLIENCQFQYFGRLFWTYQPAVSIGSFSDYSYNNDCMGITVQHNEIHHAPHAAILFSGNANTIKYNLIHDVTQWTNDAGVIYTTGREWGTQENLIQFNLIRNCGSPLGIYTSGIYIDGVGSGVKIEGNILYQASPFYGIQHNGGRDIHTQYNIFSGHWYGLDVSNVAFEVVNHTTGSSWDLLGKLQYFNYQTGSWATAYPNVSKIPNDWTLLQGTHWLEPEGSVCYGNLHQGSSVDVYRQHNSASSLAPPVSWFSQVGGNLSQVDPLFTDPANLDFRLQPGSPMFTIPGFPGIDVTQIGIQR